MAIIGMFIAIGHNEVLCETRKQPGGDAGVSDSVPTVGDRKGKSL